MGWFNHQLVNIFYTWILGAKKGCRFLEVNYNNLLKLIEAHKQHESKAETLKSKWTPPLNANKTARNGPNLTQTTYFNFQLGNKTHTQMKGIPNHNKLMAGGPWGMFQGPVGIFLKNQPTKTGGSTMILGQQITPTNATEKPPGNSPTNQPTNQPATNQPTCNQPTNQPTNLQPTNQPTCNQPTNQPATNQPMPPYITLLRDYEAKPTGLNQPKDKELLKNAPSARLPLSYAVLMCAGAWSSSLDARAAVIQAGGPVSWAAKKQTNIRNTRCFKVTFLGVWSDIFRA